VCCVRACIIIYTFVCSRPLYFFLRVLFFTSEIPMDPLDRSLVSVCVCLRCCMCVLARARVCVVFVINAHPSRAGYQSLNIFPHTHTLASTATTITITSVLQGRDCRVCIRVLKIVKAHTHKFRPLLHPGSMETGITFILYIPPLPNNNNNNKTRKRTLQAYKYTRIKRVIII